MVIKVIHPGGSTWSKFQWLAFSDDDIRVLLSLVCRSLPLKDVADPHAWPLGVAPNPFEPQAAGGPPATHSSVMATWTRRPAIAPSLAAHGHRLASVPWGTSCSQSNHMGCGRKMKHPNGTYTSISLLFPKRKVMQATPFSVSGLCQC